MNNDIYQKMSPEQKALIDILIDIRREIKRMADLLESEIDREVN
jgi:uncharacterized protein YukE